MRGQGRRTDTFKGVTAVVQHVTPAVERYGVLVFVHYCIYSTIIQYPVYAFGFSRVDSAVLHGADLLGCDCGYGGFAEDEDGEFRLSWHLDERWRLASGFRVGVDISSTEQYRKAVYFLRMANIQA